jgi:hypothetical protein
LVRFPLSDDRHIVNNLTVAALCFPDITKMIQAELDTVVGRDRMPTFDDERLLPFLGAFIKEVTRCAFSIFRSLPPPLIGDSM